MSILKTPTREYRHDDWDKKSSIAFKAYRRGSDTREISRQYMGDAAFRKQLRASFNASVGRVVDQSELDIDPDRDAFDVELVQMAVSWQGPEFVFDEPFTGKDGTEYAKGQVMPLTEEFVAYIPEHQKADIRRWMNALYNPQPEGEQESFRS